VNQLQDTAAEMLGKAAGLFVPSGTQSNLLALLTHCGRGHEYIVGQTAHTYRFEGGGAAALGGIQPQPLPVHPDGTMDLREVEANIKPDDFHFARTRLLCLENTHNGTPLCRSYQQAARLLCDRNDLSLHLDGARLFNAAIEQQVNVRDLAAIYDSVSICLSKGLGAPVGSLLLGADTFIGEARRWRKMLGGGMRQAGIVAAGGLFALHNHVERLVEDHRRASEVATVLRSMYSPEAILQATNMIHLSLSDDAYISLARHLRDRGVQVGRPRWVFHLDIDDAATAQIINALQQHAP
jgi:threonine aldolase